MVHRNTYVNGPMILADTWQVRTRPSLFLAGQMSGVEGYVESAASGLLAGLNAAALSKGEKVFAAPRTTAIGALAYYVSHANPAHYEPSNITFGIMPELAAGTLPGKQAKSKAAKKQAKFKPAAGTIQGGNDKGDVVQLRFFPQSVHVPVGGSLTLQVKSLPEAHTFSFGPDAYLQQVASAFVNPVPNAGGPPTLALNGQVAFPSDPPPALPSYDGSAHGNGFLSTGMLDGDPASPQPSSAKVTFTKAGTYGFICLLHPFMHGTVVVG